VCVCVYIYICISPSQFYYDGSYLISSGIMSCYEFGVPLSEYHLLVTLPAQTRNIVVKERYDTNHLAHFVGTSPWLHLGKKYAWNSGILLMIDLYKQRRCATVTL